LGGIESGVNNKSFNAASNTGSFYILYQDSQYTKRVMVLLQQSGANVQAKVDSSGYEFYASTSTTLLNAVNATAFNGDMGYAVGYSDSGYGLRALDRSAKITFTGNLSHTGATTLSSVTTATTVGLCGTALMFCFRYENPTLQVAGSLTDSAVTNNGNLIFANTAAQTSAGVLSGSGTLINNATADVTLSAANTFSGNVYLQAGKVIAGNAAAFGTAPVYQVSGLASTLDVNGKTITNSLYIAGNGASSAGAVTNGNATAATISGAVALNGSSLVKSDNAITVSGVISGAYDFTKSGAAALTLTAANTYTGITTINEGTLILGANAPSGANGALGNASSAVLLGNTSGASNASLLTNGAYTIARPIRVQSGNTGTTA
jgi:autotransporter-associated beta strand protein